MKVAATEFTKFAAIYLAFNAFVAAAMAATATVVMVFLSAASAWDGRIPNLGFTACLWLVTGGTTAVVILGAAAVFTRWAAKRASSFLD